MICDRELWKQWKTPEGFPPFPQQCCYCCRNKRIANEERLWYCNSHQTIQKGIGPVRYEKNNTDRPLQPEFRLSYTVKDPEAAKNQLLTKAVADAQAKAQVLTQAAGVTLKDIQSIDYSWDQIDFEIQPMSRMLMAKDCAEEATGFDINIDPDDIDVSDTVTVLWEIG